MSILTQAIVSNQVEGTLARSEVESDVEPSLRYREVATSLLDISLVGVTGGEEVRFGFEDISLAQDDCPVYTCPKR